MKVFVAVGTQLAFDRLVRTVDAWAAEHPEVEVFAQIGPGEYRPRHLRFQAFVPPPTFEHESRRADVLVTHAGTGSIFTALELGKPILVMPRRAALREHRNDHQLATAERFQELRGVNVAWDESDLRGMLERIHKLEAPGPEFSAHARPELLRAVSDCINEAPAPRGRDRVRKLLRALRI